MLWQRVDQPKLLLGKDPGVDSEAVPLFGLVFSANAVGGETVPAV